MSKGHTGVTRVRWLTVVVAATLFLPNSLWAGLQLEQKKAALKNNGLKCLPTEKDGVIFVEMIDREVEGLMLYHWKNRSRGEIADLKVVRRFTPVPEMAAERIDLFREVARGEFSKVASPLIGVPGDYELVSSRSLEEEDGVMPVVGSCRFVVRDGTAR